MGLLSAIGSAITPSVATGLDVVGNAANATYSIFNNERNYQNQVSQQNYEKELQQQIFNREDNSVQRRANDLANAGLSKTLASGSGANAGTAVTVGTPQHSTQINQGSYLDSIATKNKVEQVQQGTENMKKQNSLLQSQIDAQDLINDEQRFNNAIKSHDWQLLKDTNFMSNDSKLRSLIPLLDIIKQAFPSFNAGDLPGSIKGISKETNGLDTVIQPYIDLYNKQKAYDESIKDKSNMSGKKNYSKRYEQQKEYVFNKNLPYQTGGR